MISAVILTHNNEDILPKTLSSVSWCDEAVVVDDYSTDATTRLAQQIGATVYQQHLADDFAAQRNFGLSKAKGEWVLFVDSDEIITNELKKEILDVTGKKSDYPGYYLKRDDFLFGKFLKHGETGMVRLLRLAKKDRGVWKRPVHEVWDIQGKTGELHNPILHYPHPNVAQFLDDINRYSTLNADYLYTQKVRVRWWHIPVYPKMKFFLNYVWHQGFRDGTPGAIVAILMSFHSFLTRAKLWMRYQNK